MPANNAVEIDHWIEYTKNAIHLQRVGNNFDRPTTITIHEDLMKIKNYMV